MSSVEHLYWWIMGLILGLSLGCPTGQTLDTSIESVNNRLNWAKEQCEKHNGVQQLDFVGSLNVICKDGTTITQ